VRPCHHARHDVPTGYYQFRCDRCQHRDISVRIRLMAVGRVWASTVGDRGYPTLEDSAGPIEIGRKLTRAAAKDRSVGLDQPAPLVAEGFFRLRVDVDKQPLSCARNVRLQLHKNLPWTSPRSCFSSQARMVDMSESVE